jgi:hypothetical protein
VETLISQFRFFAYSAYFAVLFRSGFVAQISTFYAETQDAVAR